MFLGSGEDLATALGGLGVGHAPWACGVGEGAPRAGEGAGLCEPQGPALPPLKPHVLAEVYILGRIMRVGH